MNALNRRFAAILAAGAVAGSLLGAVAGAAGPGSNAAGKLAGDLTAAPATDWEGAVYPVARARDVASRRGAEMPLPAGGTFHGVRWELGEGTVAESEIDGVLSYNAACQWLRAWRDGRDATTALEILAAAPDWPALRGTDSGRFVAKVAEEASAGGGETAAAMLRDCDASHVREVAYATSIGLQPSS